jgi:hypothetical protein
MNIFVSETGIPAEGDKTIAEVQDTAEKQAKCGMPEKDGGHTPEDTNDDGKCDECEKEIVEEEGGEE